MSPSRRRTARDAARSLACTCLLGTALVVTPLSMALVAPASLVAQQSAGLKASQQVPQATGAARRTSSPPAAIADNCSRDVTAALLKWIRSVPNGSTLSFSHHGCYQVDGSLQISNRSNLTFEGNGATFRAETTGTRKRRFFWFLGGRNLALRDLTVRGANPHAGARPGAYVPALEFQHAFTFAGVDGATLDDVQAYDLYGDFVYVGPGTTGRDWSQDITIKNSRFDRSGRQGISIVAGRDIDIEHNTISGVARSMFDLEPNGQSGGALDVKIEHNTTGAAVNFWVDSKGAPGRIGDVTITDNVMREATGNVVWVFAPDGTTRGPFDIERNQLIAGGHVHDEGSRGALFFANCSGITIRDNHVQFPAGARVPAVELRNSRNATIAGNSFANAAPSITS
jgi:hypothetical protein